MSENSLLTAADAVFTLNVKTLFNAPITLENWSTSRSWEGHSLKLAETSLSLDGKLNKGFVPATFDMTVHFAANSNSMTVFDAIATASRQARTVYELNGELLLKGLGKRYNFINGCLTAYDPIPAGGEMLADRSVTIRWENILPSDL